MEKLSLSGYIIYLRLLAMKGLNVIRPGLNCNILIIIELQYFDDNFRRIALWVPALILFRPISVYEVKELARWKRGGGGGGVMHT